MWAGSRVCPITRLVTTMILPSQRPPGNHPTDHDIYRVVADLAALYRSPTHLAAWEQYRAAAERDLPPRHTLTAEGREVAETAADLLGVDYHRCADIVLDYSTQAPRWTVLAELRRLADLARRGPPVPQAVTPIADSVDAVALVLDREYRDRVTAQFEAENPDAKAMGDELMAQFRQDYGPPQPDPDEPPAAVRLSQQRRRRA